MHPPTDIHYARTGDGIDIAYAVFGSGPDLLVAPGFITHLDLMWDLPPYKSLLKFAEQFRVIIMDKRGTGLSDRSLGFGSLHDRTLDIGAVLDAVGSEKVTLYGVSESGPMACYYAAKNPDRVQALLLFATMAKIDLELLQHSDTAPESLLGMPLEIEFERWIESIGDDWGTGDLYDKFMACPPDKAAALRVLARFERNGCTPQMCRQIMRANFEIDVRPFLSMITAPTLVLHCKGDPVVPVEFGRELGRRIPGARYEEIDADFHGSWRFEDNAILGNLIEPFLQEALGRPNRDSGPTVDRVLATVLFTDIVASTERATTVGDATWKSMLTDHERVANEAIASVGGQMSGWTGDGLLATFDGPSQAVTAAQAIQEAALAMGVGVRAGIHTGEIERSDDRISGIGVHIAARVMSLANSGEVLASRTVRDISVGSGMQFDDRGTHALKGIADDWQLFAVTGR